MVGSFPSNLGIFCFLEDDWASVDYFDFLVSGDFCIQGGNHLIIFTHFNSHIGNHLFNCAIGSLHLTGSAINGDGYAFIFTGYRR